MDCLSQTVAEKSFSHLEWQFLLIEINVCCDDLTVSEFQARVARHAISRAKIASEEDEEEEGEEPQRSVLGALKAEGQSGQAPVMRTGSHKPGELLF